MQKLLLTIMIGVTMFMSSDVLHFENIRDCFKESCSIEITIDNKSKILISGEDEYENLFSCFYEMIEGAHQMPALGVSIHELALETKKQGTWLEFKFNNTIYCNEMPFEALLIEVEPNFGGFNLIRKVEGKYEGKCFYLNLNNQNMQKLYDLLQSL